MATRKYVSWIYEREQKEKLCYDTSPVKEPTTGTLHARNYEYTLVTSYSSAELSVSSSYRAAQDLVHS